jgi:hypothetical protein
MQLLCGPLNYGHASHRSISVVAQILSGHTCDLGAKSTRLWRHFGCLLSAYPRPLITNLGNTSRNQRTRGIIAMHQQSLSLNVRRLTTNRTSIVNFFLPTEPRHPGTEEMWLEVKSMVSNLAGLLRSRLPCFRYASVIVPTNGCKSHTHRTCRLFILSRYCMSICRGVS